jgi:hypothetical protein
MPILMIALFALAVFVLIGVLLAAAVVLEPRKVKVNVEDPRSHVDTSADRPAA